MEIIGRLEKWYFSQCNGDWEHEFGISIGNLDNPGWLVTIDLMETTLENKLFNEVLDERTKTDWIDCVVKENQFRGMGGSFNLTEIVEIFLIWAEAN